MFSPYTPPCGEILELPQRPGLTLVPATLQWATDPTRRPKRRKSCQITPGYCGTVRASVQSIVLTPPDTIAMHARLSPLPYTLWSIGHRTFLLVISCRSNSKEVRAHKKRVLSTIGVVSAVLHYHACTINKVLGPVSKQVFSKEIQS